MQKTMFRKLLSYYLDCLEEEDLRGLSFSVSQNEKSYFLGDDGSFLLKDSKKDFTARPSYFLNYNKDNPDESERLFIGYPIRIHENRVSPLYFLEVDVKYDENEVCSLSVTDGSCLLNHHLFGSQGNGIESSLNLQNELECEQSALQESLTKSLKFLDLNFEELGVIDRFDEMSLKSKEAYWSNNFILFRGGRSAVNAMLKKDIVTLLKYPKFLENISGTALESFLNGVPGSQHSIDMSSNFFNLNDDQKCAVQAGLSQKLTVITGPPGTGKSQVVSNILAICALNQKTVLFASKNNKAVDVVNSKLQAILGSDNWVLRLGNNAKIESCRDKVLAQIGSVVESSQSTVELNEGLFKADLELKEISRLRSELDKGHAFLNGCESEIQVLENELNSDWLMRTKDKGLWDKNDEKVKERVGKYCEQLVAVTGAGLSGLWLKLISMLFPVRFKKHYLEYIESNLPLYLNDVSDVLSHLRQNDSYVVLYNIFSNFLMLMRLKYQYVERARLEEVLLQLPTASDLKEREAIVIDSRIQIYQKKLQSTWGARVYENRSRLIALCRRYFSAIKTPPVNFVGWKKFGEDFLELIKTLNVWIVTNLSARKSIPLEAKAFDVLVIDEASQCDIISAIPLLYRAKSVIIIGDPNQLQNITLINAKKEKEIAKKHGVDDLLYTWSYRTNSIYDLAESKILDDGGKSHLLSFHYRCHPDIIAFSNKELYGNKLTAKTDMLFLQNKFEKSELGVFWHDVKGAVPESSTSAYNQDEIEYILALIEGWRNTLETRGVSIGIVTPFAKQVEKLKIAIKYKERQWGESFVSSITVGTAHRFQGDECDLIIFSPVVSRGIKDHLSKWVASTDELLNVAISRARGAFHVVGDEASCREAGYLLEKLVVYIQNSRASNHTRYKYESPAEEVVGEILASLGLTYMAQVEKGSYRLDFVVTTPFGSKINLEVDGRQHYTSEHVSNDAIRDNFIEGLGYKVVRVSAKDVFTRRESVMRRISRIV